jgi:hypothetical protein
MRVLVFTFMLLGCKEEAPKGPPQELLSQAQMVELQVKLQLAEALVSGHRLRMDTSLYLFHRIKDSIFVKAGVDTALYRKSYQWYANNIEYMDAIYRQVNDSLAARKASGNIRF